jgi:hypothetical protein
MKNKIYWTAFFIVALINIVGLPYILMAANQIINHRSSFLLQVEDPKKIEAFVTVMFFFSSASIFLVIRRIYLTFKLKKGVPSSFRGWKVYFSRTGFASVILALLVLVIYMVIEAGFGILFGMLKSGFDILFGMLIVIPLPLIYSSFIFTEVSSIRNNE